MLQCVRSSEKGGSAVKIGGNVWEYLGRFHIYLTVMENIFLIIFFIFVGVLIVFIFNCLFILNFLLFYQNANKIKETLFYNELHQKC